MTPFVIGLALLLLLERAWRQVQVIRFFRRPPPEEIAPPRRISILQPILSGDPTLAACLEANLRHQTVYPVEFVWLLDADDVEARRVCEELVVRYPDRSITIAYPPPPEAGQSPKMIKLIAGVPLAHGDVFCVLDDDTILPDFGLEQCLPYLWQSGAGLAFGLPYYVRFANLWSACVSCFVNATSLLTYVPYTVLTEPVTINGMFYAVRRDVLESVGGFGGLETILADDFAVAQRFRQAGLRLVQTPLRHGISTHVRDFAHYRNLLHRWFTFPRESLLRHLSARERLIVLGMGAFANLMPLLLLFLAMSVRSPFALLAAALVFVHGVLVAAHLNRAYLRKATPIWVSLMLTPLILLLFPLQMLFALLSPQRHIVWRGHRIAVNKGGGLHIVRRRNR